MWVHTCPGGQMLDRSDDSALPPVGALLRRPAVVWRHEVMTRLRDAGFDDVLPAHLGVFQYPGPDGLRPGVLAVRTKASKQAMNHLLHQLESGGYIRRESHPDDRRTRVVRLTDRGRAAADVIAETTHRLEAQWAEALGESVYEDLARALIKLEALFDEQVHTGS